MRIHLDVVRGRAAPQAIEVEASSLDDARLQALQQGYTVLALRPDGSDWRRLLAVGVARAPRFDTIVFVEQLRDLLGAGLSLIEALSTLRRAALYQQRPVLELLIRRLRGGQRLSDALAVDPHFS